MAHRSALTQPADPPVPAAQRAADGATVASKPERLDKRTTGAAPDCRLAIQQPPKRSSALPTTFDRRHAQSQPLRRPPALTLSGNRAPAAAACKPEDRPDIPARADKVAARLARGPRQQRSSR